ncbi:MAG: mechanosensitive ion channel [Elusimicrobia bacterium]|nr:mechanosensitive ion channel [Elusimicrobiota bacterium]
MIKRRIVVAVILGIGLWGGTLAWGGKSGSAEPVEITHKEESLSMNIAVASQSLKEPLGEVRQRASNLGIKIAFSIALVMGAFLAIRLGLFILNTLSERAARYRFLKKAGPAFQVLVWSATIYVVVVWVFHPQRETLLAFMTASGVAIGFASQDMLKNIFGGLMIVLDRPFQVGDKIKVGEFYGEVVEIGLRTTRIVTPDDNTVSVPNMEIVNKSVSNANSGALDCQVVTEIYLPPQADILIARKIAWEAAITSPHVYLKKPVTVVVVEKPIERRVLTQLKIKAYVLDTRLEFAFSSDVTEAILNEFKKRGWGQNEIVLTPEPFEERPSTGA